MPKNQRRRHEERAREEAERQQHAQAPVRGYASPPCAMHEVDPAYMGLPADPARRQKKRRGANAATVNTQTARDDISDT